MKNKGMIITIVLVLLVGIFIIYSGPGSNDNKVSATVYKSANCGCCNIHASYIGSKGDFNVDINNMVDTSSIKNKYNIPLSLQSCHTTIIGGYFIEGHIPMEAIDKLLLEQPDIDGIAMPGMPSGSPGMPGRKMGDFVIYSVKGDQILEFMRI